MRLGVFLPNWVGDVVMATPTLRALRKLTGQGEMVGVMRPYVADVLAGSDWFDRQLLYAKKPSRPEHHWSASLAQLRELRLDRIVLLTNSLRTAWMAWQTGAAERIGQAGNFRNSLLTTKVYPPRQGRRRVTLPAIDGYLQVATAAGCPPESPTLELATTAADEQAADEVWRQLELPADGVAVLNTGGAFGAAKIWPAEHFARLAQTLVERHGLQVLINCGPKERDAARTIVDLAGDPRVTSLAAIDALPLGLTKACIRRSSLLVTTDSGPRFFGVAFGVPTVGLFGPTSVVWTRTYDDCETTLSLDLECQPCMKRSCPLSHHRCMQDLSVEQVAAAVAEQLKRVRRHAA